MNRPATVLVVDDNPQNVKLLADLLTVRGYDVVRAMSGEQALRLIAERPPDLVLLDVIMPGLSGYDVCRFLRANAATEMLPVVMVTALDPAQERVKGLEAGADDFLPKPINSHELLVRVRSLLRIKFLYDTVQTQAKELAEWNHSLSRRVAEQVAQVERLGRLKRFFSPQLADMIVAGGVADPLRSHRREVVVVFLDLHGFTPFAEVAEPDVVMSVLREFHAAMGELVLKYQGTLERFTGDGMMIFFNDPVEVPDAAERGLHMALAMQDSVAALSAEWLRRGVELGLGIGIAQGVATIGAIGFEGRHDYGAIGSVTNLAARLCSEARAGEILVSRQMLRGLEAALRFTELGEVCLRGFSRPIAAAKVTGAYRTAEFAGAIEIPRP